MFEMCLASVGFFGAACRADGDGAVVGLVGGSVRRLEGRKASLLAASQEGSIYGD